MPERDQSAEPLQPGTSFPGRLTALLRDLAHAPTAGGGAALQAELQPGDVVGRFEVVGELGRGGFGVVYQARDTGLRRDVALKLIRPGLHGVLGEDRLLREAESAARLSHPNVVTLYDAGHSDRGPYLVMEFLRGRTLAARLLQGPLPLEEALRIGHAIAEGLAHAHGQGIVHRDLKPANVFLTDRGRVKILDLGMAYAFGQRRLEGGTPGAMAPEQQRGAPEDERTDVYALGAMLTWMLTGRPPAAASPGSRAAPRAPRLTAHPGLEALVAEMLQPDPVDRPRDAGEVLARLRALHPGEAGGPWPDAPTPGQPPPTSWTPRRWVGLSLAALLAIGATGLAAHLLRQPPGEPVSPAAAIPSIAVLPFEDLSPRRDQGPFADGLAEELLASLSRLEGLRIPGRTSSFAFKGRPAALVDIGKALNVATVLEGSVRLNGQRIRVTARVVDVADGFQRWNESYDRELTDLFAVQEEIARAVASALGVKRVAAKSAEGPALPAPAPEAYLQYLIGRQHRRALTKEGMGLAVTAFERSIALDPGFAPAWASLGLPLHLLSGYERDAAAARELLRRALEAVERGVSLAPDLPEALSARAGLRLRLLNDLAGARVDLERALRLNGNDPDTLRQHALLLLFSGQLSEAAGQARRSVALDPLGQAWILLGTILQFSGQLEPADEAYRHHLELQPGNTGAQVGLARNLLLQGRLEEALAAFERLPDEVDRLWGRAATQHALGRTEAARASFDQLRAARAGGRPGELAQLLAWRGEPEAAVALLEQAWAGGVVLTADIAVDPFLRSLRGEPRFQALVELVRRPRPYGPASQPGLARLAPGPATGLSRSAPPSPSASR